MSLCIIKDLRKEFSTNFYLDFLRWIAKILLKMSAADTKKEIVLFSNMSVGSSQG